MDQKKKSPYNENSQELRLLQLFHTFQSSAGPTTLSLVSLVLVIKLEGCSLWPPSSNPNPSPASRNLTPFSRNLVPYNLNNILSRRMNRAYFFSFWFLFVFLFFYCSFIIRFFFIFFCCFFFFGRFLNRFSLFM